MKIKFFTSCYLLSAIGFSAFASGGGVQYFDVNGATAGFGSPSTSGLYDMAGATLATTTLTTGFTSGATVTSVVVTSASGIIPGETMTGAGVPAAVLVTSVSGTTISVSSFTSTAASSGSYAFGNPLSWSGSGVGNAATTAFVSGDIMTFGEIAGDTSLQATFAVALDAAGPGNILSGITVNSTGVNVTLTGAAGVHPAASTIWKVNAGSVLTEDDTSQAPGGMNFNNETVLLAGGLTTSGTTNFKTPIGNNSPSAFWTQVMPGGMVNFDWSTTGPSTFGGSYTLETGTLNFQTAAACSTAFSGFQPGSQFVIDAGTTIDNTSAATQALGLGNGIYVIGGSFTFIGSSSLNLGTANVTIIGIPTVTVTANVLTIGGIISGAAGAGLTKAGPGNLLLNNTETYTGATTISEGTLSLGSSGSIIDSSGIVISGGATFDVSASGATLGDSQTLTAEVGTASINGNLVMSAGSQLVMEAGATLTVIGGTFTMNDNHVTMIPVISPLSVNTYTLITPGIGGSVAGSVAASSVTVSGAGLAPGNFGLLQISGGALQLVVAALPPNLTSTFVGPDSVVVSWPNTGSFTLQQNSNLADPGGWVTSNYPITTANNTNSITITPPTGNLFFRLKK